MGEIPLPAPLFSPLGGQFSSAKMAHQLQFCGSWSGCPALFREASNHWVAQRLAIVRDYPLQMNRSVLFSDGEPLVLA